jgi:predicted nuclease of predicted toxin-antitoxin system
MKLLFDQNLSAKLCRELSDLFPESRQVGQLGLAQATDSQIWDAARESGFMLVSQDTDFAEMAFHKGPTPKVIWLRCGNQPTAYVAGLIRARAEIIREFEANPHVVCLEIF